MFYCAICDKEQKEFQPKVDSAIMTTNRYVKIDFPEPLCTPHLEMLYHYNKMHTNTFHRDFKDIIEFAKSIKAESILEVGCGPGLFYKNYKDKLSNFKYLGIDKREAAIKMARIFSPEIPFTVINIYEELLDNKYDLVFARHVMLHQETLKKFLERISLFGNIIVCMENYDFSKVKKAESKTFKDNYFHGELVPLNWQKKYTKGIVEKICNEIELQATFDRNWLIVNTSVSQE